MQDAARKSNNYSSDGSYACSILRVISLEEPQPRHAVLMAQIASQEAAPLGEHDIPDLLNLLRHCLSHDASTQKAAETSLAALETRTGFCACMAVRVVSRALTICIVQLTSCDCLWVRAIPAAGGRIGGELTQRSTGGVCLPGSARGT